MIAYKFLLPGRIAPFSGAQWPAAGQWLAIEGPLEECRNGLHACRVGDLSYWLSDELWKVELDGELIRGERKIAARRARLRSQVATWDTTARRDFAWACIRRSAQHAARELRAAGLPEAARALDAAGDAEALLEAARAAAEQADAQRARPAAHIVGYLEEAVQSMDADPVSVTAYVAAHIGDVSAEPGSDGFAAERAAQSRWIGERLSLLSAGDV
jgi:hypothetical protein